MPRFFSPWPLFLPNAIIFFFYKLHLALSLLNHFLLKPVVVKIMLCHRVVSDGGWINRFASFYLHFYSSCKKREGGVRVYGFFWVIAKSSSLGFVVILRVICLFRCIMLSRALHAFFSQHKHAAFVSVLLSLTWSPHPASSPPLTMLSGIVESGLSRGRVW